MQDVKAPPTRVKVVETPTDLEPKEASPNLNRHNSSPPPKSALKQSSEAFKMIGQHSYLSQQEFYEFENRLRGVVSQMLTPLEQKATAIREQQDKCRDDIYKQRKYVDNNMEWVRSRGDANKVEDYVNKRFEDNEELYQRCHNVLKMDLERLGQDVDKLRFHHTQTNDSANATRVECFNLQQLFCKTVQGIELRQTELSDYLTQHVAATTKKINEFDSSLSQVTSFSSTFMDQIDMMKRVQALESESLNSKVNKITVEFMQNQKDMKLDKEQIINGIEATKKQCIGQAAQLVKYSTKVSELQAYVEEVLPNFVESFGERMADQVQTKLESLKNIEQLLDERPELKGEILSSENLQELITQIQQGYSDYLGVMQKGSQILEKNMNKKTVQQLTAMDTFHKSLTMKIQNVQEQMAQAEELLEDEDISEELDEPIDIYTPPVQQTVLHRLETVKTQKSTKAPVIQKAPTLKKQSTSRPEPTPVRKQSLSPIKQQSEEQSPVRRKPSAVDFKPQVDNGASQDSPFKLKLSSTLTNAQQEAPVEQRHTESNSIKGGESAIQEESNHNQSVNQRVEEPKMPQSRNSKVQGSARSNQSFLSIKQSQRSTHLAKNTSQNNDKLKAALQEQIHQQVTQVRLDMNRQLNEQNLDFETQLEELRKSQAIVVDDLQTQIADMFDTNKTFQTEVEERAQSTDQRIEEAMTKLTEAFGKFEKNHEFNNSMQAEFKRLDKDIADCGQQVEVCIKQGYQHKNFFTLQLNEQADRVEAHGEWLQHQEQDVIRIIRELETLKSAQLMDLALQRQDVLDRQNTNLYGAEASSESPVTINQNCMSCSGNAPYIKKAFKIACLAYKSSQVPYQGKNYERSDLFKMQEEALQPEKPIGVRLHQSIQLPFVASVNHHQGTSVNHQQVINNAKPDIDDSEPSTHLQAMCSKPIKDKLNQDSESITSPKTLKALDRPFSAHTAASSNVRGVAHSLAQRSIISPTNRPLSKADQIRTRTSMMNRHLTINENSQMPDSFSNGLYSPVMSPKLQMRQNARKKAASSMCKDRLSASSTHAK